MIAYDLQCAQGHTFEGWFEDRKAYISKQKKGLIACPTCNDNVVEIMPSTFGIKSSQTPMARPLSTEEADLNKIRQEAIEYVEKNFDDVGCDFAKEALKIHYGAAEPRNIRGVSTKEEEKTLKEEGIQYFKIPMSTPPDTEN